MDDTKENPSGDLLLATGLEEAFVGVGRRCGQEEVAVYSIQKAIAVLMKEGATEEEAREYLEFNSIGAWVGPLTPVWLEAMTLSEFYNMSAGKEETALEEAAKEMLNATGWEEKVSVH